MFLLNVLDEVLYLPRLIGSAVGNAVREAWEASMTVLFLTGERLGMWVLRKATEEKGLPHMTPRLGSIIMWTGLAMQAGILSVMGLKLWWLWAMR